MRVYFDAVISYETQDIEVAVTNLLSGAAPGHNPAYAPPAPLVAAEVRRVMNLRLESAHRERMRRPALPPPEIEHTPEQRARIKDLVRQAAANLSSISKTDDQRREIEIAERWQRVNSRFVPDLSEQAISQRLGFTAGDRDGEEDAA